MPLSGLPSILPLLGLSSILVLVEPESYVARFIFQLPENAKYRRFGLAKNALTHHGDRFLAEVGLSSQKINADAHGPVHFALGFDSKPKDISKGFIFGSDPETCDVLLARGKRPGISGNHFSISVDWQTGNPIITCLTPFTGPGGFCVHLRDTERYYTRKNAWTVLKPETSIVVRISEAMKLMVHTPGRADWEPAYSEKLQRYFKTGQDTIPKMINLKLYDPEPTPLLISRGRGMGGTEYFTTSTSVGETVVTCEAKSHDDGTEASKTFIIKRFRSPKDPWVDHANFWLSELRRMRHRHIIALEDIVTDTITYMPVYLPEPPETLKDRHLSAPLTEIDTGQVLAQVLEGLKFLHVNGIIHGSLYPGSIRIKHSNPWSIVLTDIGLHPHVVLDNSEERRLYASQPRNGYTTLVPVMDTWSAGVVGLDLLSSGGLPPRRLARLRPQAAWARELVDRAAHFHANERPGPDGRKDAALFLTRVLQVEYFDRLTAEECLQDPWIQNHRLPIGYDRESSASPSDQLSQRFPAGHEWAENEGVREGGAENERKAAHIQRLKNLVPVLRKARGTATSHVETIQP